MFLHLLDLCITSSHKSSPGGGDGPECRADPLRPAGAGEAPPAPEQVAADQGRHGVDT